jgi:hypothetical protein
MSNMQYRLRKIVVGCIVLACVAITSARAHAQQVTDPAVIVEWQQTQAAELAASWLRSADARERAWGAYLALRDQRRELLPRLSALVDAHPVTIGPLSVSDRDLHDAMQSVLDAIIQMGGRLPAPQAARLYPQFPAQSIILLSYGDPAADPFLLKIFREETRSTGAWLTAGNRLMDRKPQGFAAAVLDSFTVNASVLVVDRGADAGAGRGFAGSCPSGLPSPRVGWPVVGNYSFGGYGVLVSRGPAPTFYSRSLGAPAAPGAAIETPCSYLGHDRNGLREQFLSSLAGDPAGNPLVRSQFNKNIEWQNEAQYLRDLSAFIRDQQTFFSELRRKLMNAQLLTPEESAAAVISLEIQVVDKRSAPSSLPRLQTTETNVRILN